MNVHFLFCAVLAVATASGSGAAHAQSDAAALEAGIEARIEARVEALGRRIERLKDANEVEILQRTYGYFVDKGMWTEVSELFADDGTLEIGGRGVFVGRGRVLEYLQTGLGHERPLEGRLINHMQFQPIVTIAPDGQTASLRARAFVMSAVGPGAGGWGLPLYENTYRKENGVWKLASLRGPFTMYTNWDSWAKFATPNTRPDSFLPPPDRLPTTVYLTYPSPYIVPYHYPHPVTGREVDTTVDIQPSASEPSSR